MNSTLEKTSLATSSGKDSELKQENKPLTVTHNFRDVANAVLRMEVDLRLLRDESYGPFARMAWERSRFSVHVRLRQELLGHGRKPSSKASSRKSSTSRGKRITGKTRRFFYLLTNALSHGWLRAPRHREWLIVTHGRRRLRSDGFYEDIYTEEMVKEIGTRKCVVYDPVWEHNHFQPRLLRYWYKESSQLIETILGPIVCFKYVWQREGVNRLGRDVNNYLSQAFGTRIEVDEIINRSATTAARKMITYRLMLRWLRPKKVLLVCSYGLEELILSAREMNVPSVEIQHGVVTPEHLGYSVSPGTVKKSFPDYVLLFGSYWKETVPWSIERSRLVEVGFPFFEHKRSEVSTVTRRRRVVCLSQHTIGFQLSEFVIKLAKNNPGFEIIFKLHPMEQRAWKELYPGLDQAVEASLLSVADDQASNLYELLSSATWQIGVNSTALFEGMALGCKTILLNASGIEYMDNLIATDTVQVVSEPEEIDWNHVSQNHDSIDFFCLNWKENFNRFLDLPLAVRQPEI